MRYFAILVLAGAAAAAPVTLSNDRVRVELNDRGLAALTDAATSATYHFSREEFAVALSGQRFESASLPVPIRTTADGRVTYAYTAGPYRLDVIYELRPGWRFVSKQLVIRSAPAGKFKLDEFVVWRAAVTEPVRDVYTLTRARQDLGTKDYGGFLHFDRSRGLFALGQNPYLAFERDQNAFSVSYKPDMDWDISWGPFEADRGLLAPYLLSGRRQPERMLPEWRMGANEAAPGLDEAEVAAFTELVRAFLLYRPAKPLNMMVGWCANDYQIDIATPEGRTEYKRILDQAAALGMQHVLFAPANSQVSRREDSRDDWGWEYLLWLGMGQKIRQNQWDPATGAIPSSIQEMLDYAHAKNLGLLAYVYPVMGFTQNKEWLLGARGARANIGVHSFQDWLIASLETFAKHTGVTGYSFDHTFLGYEGASKYAQWWGWRRIMETLRRDMPDIVMDGRQAYQLYGPWTWLAGSFPHPTGTDEQPESFISFPDLKLDRVSADRERYTAFRYRDYEFAPSEIVPGFITHQTGRNDDFGRMPEANTRTGRTLLPFRQRDWDYLGWRYSLLSSIAIAGWNNVVDLIPARDEQEFRNFSAADRDWFRHWIEWTAEKREYLRNTRPLLGQPALGAVDGTEAISGDRGYLFLFNPNGRRLSSAVPLHVPAGRNYLVRELYPQEGRLIGKPGGGFWSGGDNVSVDLDGGSATVLELEPAPGNSREPMLFNVPGVASIAGTALTLTGVRGEPGTTATVEVLLPADQKLESVRVNGEPAVFSRAGGMVTIPLTFAGAPFRHYQQIDRYDPAFTGGAIRASFTVPRRIFDQLEARRSAWPIAWTAEDYRSTWLAPHRLLLYVQLAEPDDQWNAALKIDGRSVDLLKAYASVRPNKRNFVGFYADVSLLSADQQHTLELTLPQNLKPGQFQGVFFENVEPEYTPLIRKANQ